MSSPEDALRRCWRGLAEATGQQPPEQPSDSTIEHVLARHREPHRHYHTAVHVMRVLRDVEALLAAHPPERSPLDADVIRAAALFHDVIYDPRSSTNEADSASYARRCLAELGWARGKVERVGELIQATAAHVAPEDADGHVAADAAVLLDADLAILGSSPAQYAAYVAGVRAEYDHVGPEQWRLGRSTVLRSFLDRRRLYATAEMGAARERRARANLTAELADLADLATGTARVGPTDPQPG